MTVDAAATFASDAYASGLFLGGLVGLCVGVIFGAALARSWFKSH